MEAKCKCQNCNEKISFPVEMAGQTTNCPHCNKPTILLVPPKPAPVKMQPPPQKPKVLIENRLEMAGSAFYALFTIAWILTALSAVFTYTNATARIESTDYAFTLVVVAVALYIQGVVIRLVFHAIAEAVRLLRIISFQLQESVLKSKP